MAIIIAVILFIIIVLSVYFFRNRPVDHRRDYTQKSVSDKHTLTNDQILEIEELLKNNENIKAIKLYRDITGAGLKESKDFIDSLYE